MWVSIQCLNSEFTLCVCVCVSFPSVVPSLLVCLCSPVCEVRRAAVACLQTLQSAKSSVFLPVVQALLKATEELISDPAYLSQVS